MGGGIRKQLEKVGGAFESHLENDGRGIRKTPEKVAAENVGGTFESNSEKVGGAFESYPDKVYPQE